MSHIDQELDRLSLEQALRDVEIANARVVDLTQRLIRISDELAETQRQEASLRRFVEEMRARRVVRLLDGIAAVRNAIRP
ncbi:MAG TPA: hypothetical protein VHG90_04545 [Acidimicrobiales bacterium]|nr:hypothetical protein [Acidimicrobiales bacterium]